MWQTSQNKKNGVPLHPTRRKNTNLNNKAIYLLTYTKYEEKNANGDIIDTAYTDAMGYINEQRKVYTYATKENLKNRKLYEISYFKTEEPIDTVNKTYYVDILENDDFSEDYTYGWRYSKNKKNKDITSYCHQKWIEFYRFVTTSTNEEFKANIIKDLLNAKKYIILEVAKVDATYSFLDENNAP